MAKESKKEEVAELPSPAAAPAAGGGGNPWLPVIAIVILSPILTWVMGKFVIAPMLKAELASAVAGAGHGEEAGGHDAKPAAKPAAKPKADAHGGGGHGAPAGGHGGGEEAYGNMVTFDLLKTNLARPASTLIIVKFAIEGSDPDFAGIVQAKKPAIIDSTLKILSLLTLVDTQRPGIQNIVKTDLITAFNDVLGGPYVENLYFLDFVTQ